MKTILTIFACITLFSCSKDPNNSNTQQPPSATGSIQYKVNGNLTVLDNVDYAAGQYALFYKQLKGSLLPATRYLLNAQKGANTAFIFPIVTDSLQEINYHMDSTTAQILVTEIFNGQQSGLLFTGDYFDVNVTSYKGGRISGTFKAALTPFVLPATGLEYYNRSTTVITEGVINNVQVIY